MKPILIALIGLFALLQYELWFAKDSFIAVLKLKHAIATQKKRNLQLQKRNATLIANIKDLKSGNQALEEQARNEMGMTKKGEIFYQVVKH